MTEPEIFYKTTLLVPPTNFIVESGSLKLECNMPKTMKNRIQWWFASLFFPFKITYWVKEEELL